jgi:hypothetical protein
VFKALVISPNEGTVDFGSLLAVARSEACRREHVSVNPTVRALAFVAELGVYVAVYEGVDIRIDNNFSVNKKVDSGKTLTRGPVAGKS